MARSKQRDAWNHTANLLALIINVNRDPRRGQPASADEIHPFREDEPLTRAEKREHLRGQFAALKQHAFAGQSRTILPFTPANIIEA